ncbi:MAG TPA: LuxR C-terminal-related transcriptional regulator [Ktedonobacteraceae bacterium]
MRTNLPCHLTTFVGREEDLSAVGQLLYTKRLVTLLGIGGIGKTRLALRVAGTLEDLFPDGIWCIELASLSDPALLPHVVMRICGLREHGELSPLAILIEHFRTKHVLLLLDNCEHLLEACAELAGSLLATCAHVTLFTTSREQLGITGEVLWRLSPLSSPIFSSTTCFEPEQLLSYESVQLWLDRASAVNPQFAITPQNSLAVAQICASLDGLPLALELAAARLTMFSVEQLAARLSERFQVLKQGSRIAPTRHQTLQATLDWSYALLFVPEQVVFERLAIFPGSWTLDALENICLDEKTGPYDALEILTNLVNKSLVVAECSGGLARYHLLETVQLYAQQRYQYSEEAASLEERYWTWYLHFAEEAAIHLRGAQQHDWLICLEEETENLHMALERSYAAGALEVTTRIACALEHFWAIHSRLQEGRQWYETLLAAFADSPSRQAPIVRSLVEILCFQGEYLRIRSLLETWVAYMQEQHNRTGLAETLCSLGWNAFYLGDGEEAIRLCSEGLQFFQETDNQSGIAACLAGIAMAELLQRKYQQSLLLLQRIVEIRRVLQDYGMLSYALSTQTRAAALAGEDKLANEACRETLLLVTKLKQPFGAVLALEAAATIASARDDRECATRLFSAAHALRTVIGILLPPGLRELRERDLLPLRLHLGETAFAECWSAGASLTAEQACEEARLLVEEPPTQVPSSSSYPAGLSQREMDVLRLVAACYSDAQVAKELTLSSRTVSTHLRTIYRKLGVNSRQAATRFAIEHQLFAENSIINSQENSLPADS